MARGRHAAKHGVEGHHAEYVRERKIEQVGHMIERFVGKMTDFILNQVKHGNQGRLRVRITSANPADRLLSFGGKVEGHWPRPSTLRCGRHDVNSPRRSPLYKARNG